MPRKKPEPKKIELNEEQRAVVSSREGYYAVLAGPGAGKTSVLVERLVKLVEEGVPFSDMVSLSFTSTAAKNLKSRVEDRVGKLSTTRTAGCITFHSMALSFAVEEHEAFPFKLADFPLATEPVAAKLSFEAARKYEIDPRSLRSAISLFKRRRISAKQAVRDAENSLKAADLKTALAYQGYDKKCADQGLLDFDSLIYQMVEILDKKPEVRARWVRDYQQLDESQDMSKIEWDLAKLISGKSVLAVGDVSQGIYGFRGSDPRLFRDMSEVFPGTKTLYLSCNFRSSPEIVDFIRPISSTQDLAEKFHTPNEHGPVPVVKGFSSPQAEAEWIIKRIKGESNAPSPLV